MYVGFWRVDVPPSPKVHAHEVGVPVLASVKLASSAAVVDVNAATGVLPVVTVADPLDVPVQPVASLTLDTV